jgi:hypothetical protein
MRTAAGETPGLFAHGPARIAYPLECFDFPGIVAGILGSRDLGALGLGDEMAVRTRETDQKTRWHAQFYAGFQTWRTLYEAFVAQFAAPFFDEPFWYQAVPTFRVHLPDNLAVGQFHTDADFGHPEAEKTFWVPLTPASDSSTIWIESFPGHDDYTPQDAVPGQCIVFEGSRLRHGNHINRTGRTRVSFDFRSIGIGELEPSEVRSINSGLPFAPAGYYAATCCTPHA